MRALMRTLCPFAGYAAAFVSMLWSLRCEHQSRTLLHSCESRLNTTAATVQELESARSYDAQARSRYWECQSKVVALQKEQQQDASETTPIGSNKGYDQQSATTTTTSQSSGGWLDSHNYRADGIEDCCKAIEDRWEQQQGQCFVPAAPRDCPYDSSTSSPLVQKNIKLGRAWSDPLLRAGNIKGDCCNAIEERQYEQRGLCLMPANCTTVGIDTTGHSLSLGQTSSPLPRPPRRLFWCGFHAYPIADALWPELAPAAIFPSGQPSSAHDILVVGRFGPCAGNVASFRGRVLYVNGEASDEPPLPKCRHK
eukprot:COSAG05_NODE_534_length_8874_cov_19.159544_7_plen_310_part_00